ncbi:MAG: hypothetical protein GTO18_17045 [Anaerolineales bacterium]|nr:hypothetical protein [Anaerolineales bacterium]
MSIHKIQSILKDLMEEEIPSSQVNLWPAVKADLVAGKQPFQQGDPMNTVESRRIPRLALAISLVLVLLVIFIATPQGRSFAQSLLELFTRAESTTIPLEDSQILSDEPDETTATALPPSPLISVAEAEAQVGFDIAEFSYVPEGFEYLGVRLYGNNVSMDYMTEGYGHLIIMQSQEGFYESDWDRVPADDIVPVKIGELDGEITQGTFIRYPGENSLTWNPDAAFTRMRWVKDDLWFEIALHGDAHQYLDLEGLIELAENLAFKP